MVEQDVIGHLMDVERLASDLLLDAQAEADKRKAAAREKADQEYRSAYEKIIAELEKNFSDGCRVRDESRDREFVSFNSRLASIKKDRTAFNTYLDSIYSGS